MNSLARSSSGGDVDRSTLGWLMSEFERDEGCENPDVTVKLSTLRVTASDTVKVPGLPGNYEMGDWPRRQLARLLGVRWDKWFAGTSGEDRAEEVNRRLARADVNVRIRTIRKVDGDGLVADGAVRAIVSPSYTAIPDTVVAHTLREALAGVEPNPRLVRADVTDQSSTYVVMVGKPFRVGQGGQVGDIWGGLMVRNSGVGFTKLSVSVSWTRVACLNGLVIPMPEFAILRSVHRGLDIGGVRERIVAGLDGVAAKLHRGADLLEASVHQQVADAEREVRNLLRSSRLPLNLVGDVMSAFQREPGQTRFAVSQAVTWAAQRVTPELRYEMEVAAGRYLAQA